MTAKAKKQSTITPLGARVLVSPKEASGEQTIAGIIIPETTSSEKPATGTVAAVGDKVKDVKVGDTVLFSKYGYDEVKLGDTTYYILKEDSILAVVK